MNKREQKRHADFQGTPDNVRYEVSFYLSTDDCSLTLYETLHLDSPPLLPEEGEYVSFQFLTDEDGEEVFRTDGYVDAEDVGTDNPYTKLTSPEFKIDSISTTYEKGLTDRDKAQTTIKKSVILTSV